MNCLPAKNFIYKSPQNECLCVSDRIGNWKLALDFKKINIAAEGQAPNEKTQLTHGHWTPSNPGHFIDDSSVRPPSLLARDV